MCAEVELNKLSELTDCGRELTTEAEVADINACYTTIRVQLNAGLVAPKINILVEIPVYTASKGLAGVVPIISIKALPNAVESIVVLDVVISLIE